MNGQSPRSIIRLPDDFPWHRTIGLLLDALQVKNLLQRLYQWSAAPEVQVLYHGTQWAEISHLSPYLIRLRDPDDQILQQFLANVGNHWGYLLVSDGSWDELVTHMRWLTSICPVPEDEMFLRIAYPAVAHALFAPDCHPSAELFGPCQQIIVANTQLEGWQQYHRSGESGGPLPSKPYRPNDAQWTALGAAALGKSVGELYQHMRHFFPEYREDLTSDQRLEHTHLLVKTAIARGFRTRQEIFLYANVLGFLGDDGVHGHQDIVELLIIESDLSPLQRVDRASALAAQRYNR